MLQLSECLAYSLLQWTLLRVWCQVNFQYLWRVVEQCVASQFVCAIFHIIFQQMYLSNVIQDHTIDKVSFPSARFCTWSRTCYSCKRRLLGQLASGRSHTRGSDFLRLLRSYKKNHSIERMRRLKTRETSTWFARPQLAESRADVMFRLFWTKFQRFFKRDWRYFDSCKFG